MSIIISWQHCARCQEQGGTGQVAAAKAAFRLQTSASLFVYGPADCICPYLSVLGTYHKWSPETFWCLCSPVQPLLTYLLHVSSSLCLLSCMSGVLWLSSTSSWFLIFVKVCILLKNQCSITLYQLLVFPWAFPSYETLLPSFPTATTWSQSCSVGIPLVLTFVL